MSLNVKTMWHHCPSHQRVRASVDPVVHAITVDQHMRNDSVEGQYRQKWQTDPSWVITCFTMCFSACSSGCGGNICVPHARATYPWWKFSTGLHPAPLSHDGPLLPTSACTCDPLAQNLPAHLHSSALSAWTPNDRLPPVSGGAWTLCEKYKREAVIWWCLMLLVNVRSSCTVWIIANTISLPN